MNVIIVVVSLEYGVGCTSDRHNIRWFGDKKICKIPRQVVGIAEIANVHCN
jgi:hypothetical protein